jgi:hypothetical protein
VTIWWRSHTNKMNVVMSTDTDQRIPVAHLVFLFTGMSCAPCFVIHNTTSSFSRQTAMIFSFLAELSPTSDGGDDAGTLLGKSRTDDGDGSTWATGVDDDNMSYGAWSLSTRAASTDCSGTIASLESRSTIVSLESKRSVEEQHKRQSSPTANAVCHNKLLHCKQELPVLTEEDFFLDMAVCLVDRSLLDLRQADDDCYYREEEEEEDGEFGRDDDGNVYDTDLEFLYASESPPVIEGVVHLRHLIDADEEEVILDTKSCASQAFSADNHVASFSTTSVGKGASAHTQTCNRSLGSALHGDEDDDISHKVPTLDVQEPADKGDDKEQTTGAIFIQKFRSLRDNDTIHAVFHALDRKALKKEQWVALTKSIKNAVRKQNIRETTMAFVGGLKQKMILIVMAHVRWFKPRVYMPISEPTTHLVLVIQEQESFEARLNGIKAATTASKKSSTLRSKVLLSQSLTGKAAMELLRRERLRKAAAVG